MSLIPEVGPGGPGAEPGRGPVAPRGARCERSLRLGLLLLLSPLVQGAGGCVVPGDASPFAPVDAVPPHISETIPVEGAEDVPPDVAIDLFFSETLLWEAIAEEHFDLRSGGFPVDFTLDRSGEASRRLTLVPTEPLAANLAYTVRVSGAIQDLHHNPMGEDFLLSFEVAEDPVPFELLETTPADGETGVSLDTAIELRFSKPPAAPLVDKRHFTVEGLSRRAYSVDHAALAPTVVLRPSTPLDPETEYVVHVDGSLKAISGQVLGEEVSVRFTTAAGP